ncbi:ATP-binding protein [Dokdonella sp.]|uniref:ATP-binding protein n=1 Tax=Dokdonella sp. TaxID=2291710 RepID=UPI001B00FEAE|nr:ATP-binding protein [Dokdonella sp.]MBO9662866.1 hypothetical protein [Dokdonella sp.]
MDARHRDHSAPSPEATGAPALETLGQLAGQFAHDINNLLGRVLVGVELATRIEGDERVRTLLTGVVEAIRHQRDFTTAMAQASGRCEQAVALDAHALIEHCSDELRTALGAAALELRLDAADARIRCDPRFLRTALLHLAANARAAMPDGGRLLLTTRNRDAHGVETEGRGFLLLTAVDSGGGMTEEVRRRAFESFFSTRDGADGLGLVQVRDTARRAGGSISVETVPGQGTAISLVFPLDG